VLYSSHNIHHYRSAKTATPDVEAETDDQCSSAIDYTIRNGHGFNCKWNFSACCCGRNVNIINGLIIFFKS
jgi:hypothetical protein